MDSAYLMMGLAVFGSAFVAFLTGSVLVGALAPSLLVALYAAAGAVGSAWFFGIFAMAFIPYAAIGTVGALIGAVARRASAGKRLVSLGATVTFIAPVLVIATVLTLRTTEKQSWNEAARSSGVAYVSQHPQVLERTGPVNRVSVHSSTTGADLPYSTFTYYVEGKLERALVTVGVSGSSHSPVFAVKAIERTR